MKIVSIDMKFCGKVLRCKYNKVIKFQTLCINIIYNKNLSTVIKTQKMKKTNRLLTVKNYEP